MPHKSLEVSVEPKVLIWARKSIGRNIEEVAKRLKVSENTVASWELGQKKPTLVQLEKLAKTIYKRPLAAFFLPSPPTEPAPPTDFRTLPADREIPFSSKTRLAIRRAQRLQSLATELKGTITKETFKIGSISLSDDPEEVAIEIRNDLKIDAQTQFHWKDESITLNEWKKVLENRGILVFQLSMPIEETRGFSLIENKIPAIVLNLRDSVNGRIFSLFHEYAHLLLDRSGICDMEEQNYLRDDKTIEKFCNHLAGAILVPKNVLLGHELAKQKKWTEEILGEIAKSFKVSQEVILRRLVILGLASRDLYKRKHEEWSAKVKEKQKEKRPFKISQPKKCIKQNGAPFVSLVLDANKKGEITYSDVADYLGVRIKHIPKIEQLIGEKI